MTILKRIHKLVLGTILLLAACQGYVYAQGYDRSHLTKLNHKFTIGFERQIVTLYKPGVVALSKKTKAKEELCNTILFRMRLTSRFKLETGLSYKAIDRILNCNSKYNKGLNFNSDYQTTVPLTIQYQLNNERSRLHPYIGAGIQYYQADNAVTNRNAEINFDRSISNRLKYINIIFTQGLIYDVTPDIQITQSIHILPENGIKPVGINFGIGYRIK